MTLLRGATIVALLGVFVSAILATMAAGVDIWLWYHVPSSPDLNLGSNMHKEGNIIFVSPSLFFAYGPPGVHIVEFYAWFGLVSRLLQGASLLLFLGVLFLKQLPVKNRLTPEGD